MTDAFKRRDICRIGHFLLIGFTEEIVRYWEGNHRFSHCTASSNELACQIFSFSQNAVIIEEHMLRRIQQGRWKIDFIIRFFVIGIEKLIAE